MADQLLIALAQLNPVVGDLEGNAERAFRAWQDAKAAGADLVVFSELFITGYPPEDLILKPAFQEAAMASVEALAARCRGGGGETVPGLVIGTPWRVDGALFNAVILIEDGEIIARRDKVDLPNYGVFDEKRFFAPGPLPAPVSFRGVQLGLPICEDIWTPAVTRHLKQQGAELLIVPNGSPFSHGKQAERLAQARARVRETGLPLIYLNQLGGQDELVFDGASFGLDKTGALSFQLPAWEEVQLVTKWRNDAVGWRCETHSMAHLDEGEAAWYAACVLGLRDYVNKNGFPGVVLGLSGGIDSALVAAIAVDALGADRVHCIMLPYKYTSADSLRDAAACARALQVAYDTVPIAGPVEAVNTALSDLFKEAAPDVTEENIQSRIRGVVLMAISNKFDALVITTGNKSEMSVGYATLYGDMNGGFNPIKDLYKTQVYALARWRNAHRLDGFLGPYGEVIPQAIIDKAPTAELRENQRDQDSLPPYEVLDDILTCLVEQEMPVREIIKRGHDPALVKRIEHQLYVAEYKRRQAAPGVKISSRNFGRDRRYPITNRFREG